MKLPKIYIITNKEISTEEQLSYLKKISNINNIILQIRMPHLDDNSLEKFIVNIKKELKNVKILINNRIDLMEKFDLDGVHFKDKNIDIDLSKYKNKIFSKSTHSVESIKNAIDKKVNFVTYGPTFYTKSKEKYGDPIGFDKLIDQKLDIPIFALGGINLKTISKIDFSLFYGVAAISIFSNKDILKNIRMIELLLKT